MSDRIGALRIAGHGLAERDRLDPAAAATVGVGIQAQDLPAARLGIRARSTTATADDFDTALHDERTLARATLMRGTLHVVATEDLAWLQALFGPMIGQKLAGRWRGLGLTPRLLERAAPVLAATLSDAPRSAAEIVTELAAQGVRLPAADRAVDTHLMLFAGTEGLAVRGPVRGRTPTFVAPSAWFGQVPRGPRGDDALAELARRYFTAFSPATPVDFTTWSGLPSGRAVELIRAELEPCEVSGHAGFTLGAREPWHGTRLVAGFDNYLLGYRDRDALVPARHYRDIFEGGIIRPAVVHDGAVIGRWKARLAASVVTVEVWPFGRLPAGARADLAAEAADVGRYFARESALTVHQ